MVCSFFSRDKDFKVSIYKPYTFHLEFGYLSYVFMNGGEKVMIVVWLKKLFWSPMLIVQFFLS